MRRVSVNRPQECGTVETRGMFLGQSSSICKNSLEKGDPTRHGVVLCICVPFPNNAGERTCAQPSFGLAEKDKRQREGLRRMKF